MWINPNTQQVFILHHDIRAAFKNTSFPSVMTDENIASVGLLPVTQTAQPAFNRLTQRVAESAPIKIDGVWTQQWETVALTPEEQAAVVAEIQAEVVVATQARLDTFAKTRNYDGILSAASYAVSSHPPFADEGRYCADMRDATWGALYTVMAEVQAGTRPMPAGYADVEPLLPALTWPAA